MTLSTAAPGTPARAKGQGGSNGCAWAAMNILCLLFLAIGGWYGYRSYSLVAHGGVADGTVVDMEAHSGDDGTSYAPIVEYFVDGQPYHMTGSTSSSPPDYHVGQKVRIRYDRTKPTLARIDTFWELWLLPGIFIPLALVFAVIGNGVFAVRLFRRRPAATMVTPI
jgi:hypothetical protein